MPGLHNKSSHGAGQLPSGSICSLLPTPIGSDDDMVTKLGARGETLRKMVIRAKQKHNILTKSDIIVQEKLMRECASANVIFVAF